jgi:hypothetical protein
MPTPHWIAFKKNGLKLEFLKSLDLLQLLGGPEGPKPALGEKKTPDCPTLVVKQATKQQKNSPNQPGGRAIFL